MENMHYADELVREFLIFRGFTSTLQAFQAELSSEIGRNFQVDKILDLVFSVYIPRYQSNRLIELLNFFKQCLSLPSDMVFASTLSRLEVSVLKYYMVHALKSGRQDKVMDFLGAHGTHLLQKREEWLPWFAIPYLNVPSLDPQFRVYFSKEWADALHLSFQNFLSEVFNGTRIPALLKISSERNKVKHLKHDIKQLNNKLSELQALLETKEAELSHFQRLTMSMQNIMPQDNDAVDNLSVKTLVRDDDVHNEAEEHNSSIVTLTSGEDVIQGCGDSSMTNSAEDAVSFKAGLVIDSVEQSNSTGDTYGDAAPMSQLEKKEDFLREEDFPEVKVDFQETFLGHTRPISRCRFSASGANIANASVDGTVRIWTYDTSTPTSRNATIYCGSEIMSLDWECRSERLLLIGTANGGIKAWNVDAKRVVCDLSAITDFPSILDLKCSPVEPIFVSAAASRRNGFNNIDNLGFASLTVWNMKTWKAMSALPLGEDPPAITSLCFNHNGKILAASATDGMVHMFDMSAGLQITGWPAHDTAVCKLLFGPDETSIFSMGSDGKIFEWSLHNQGHILWSRDCSRFCFPESLKTCRHEISLDSSGKMLLTTSGLVRSPIYQVQGHMSGLRTLPHSAAITSVDWHPTLPIFITGSADHSVRVTSIC